MQLLPTALFTKRVPDKIMTSIKYGNTEFIEAVKKKSPLKKALKNLITTCNINKG